jgi:hypothetical protein
MIKRDRQWAATYFTTGVWGTDLTGVASAPGAGQFLQFDQSTSDPIGLIQKKIDDIASATGYPPNTLVLGRDTYRVIRNHADVKDRIKYTQRGIVTPEILAELFGVDEVLIPGGVHEQREGRADQLDRLHRRPQGRAALLRGDAPSIEEPSAGYTFAWTGLLPGATNAFGGVIERGREELAHSDMFQIRMAFDLQKVAAELGVFFTAAVA